MISIGLMILIVGISCATAINLDLQKDAKIIDPDGPTKDPSSGTSFTKQEYMQNQGGNSKQLQGKAVYDFSRTPTTPSPKVTPEKQGNENLKEGKLHNSTEYETERCENVSVTVNETHDFPVPIIFNISDLPIEFTEPTQNYSDWVAPWQRVE